MDKSMKINYDTITVCCFKYRNIYIKQNDMGSLKINESSRIYQKNKKKNKMEVEKFMSEKIESKGKLFKDTIGNILY